MSKYRIVQIVFGVIFVVSLLWLLLSFSLRVSPISNGGEGVDIAVEKTAVPITTPIPEETAVSVDSVEAVYNSSVALATQVSQLNNSVEALATSVAVAHPSEPQNQRENCTNSDNTFFEQAECWMGEYVVPLLGLVSSSVGLVGSAFVEKKDKEALPTTKERKVEAMRWELLKIEAELKRIELIKARRELEEDEQEQE